MKVSYHPEFARDVVRCAGQYREISQRLETRFRLEIDAALDSIKAQPTGAGHFLHTGSVVIKDVRRRNLHSFPYFVLYGVQAELLVFGALVPSASDPLTWLDRFSHPG